MKDITTPQTPSSGSCTTETDSVMVSVIVPMYCCQEYVDGVLDDLCAQEFQDLEILCIIDGSPDQTLARAEAYAQRDLRIKVFCQEHGGAGTARNLGLSMARGKYVMFADADDAYSASFVSCMVQTIEESDADIAVCHYYTQDVWKGTQKFVSGFHRNYLPRGEVVNPTQVKNLLCAFSNVCHNKIFRRSFLETHGLRFSKTQSLNDMFFVFSSLISAKRISLVEDFLYTYRKNLNPNSISSNRNLFREDLFIVYQELYNWLRKHNKAAYYHSSFCRRWRTNFHSYAMYGVSSDFQDMTVRYFSQQEPWRSMSARELYHMAGLGTANATRRMAQLQDGLSKLSPDTELYITTSNAIRRKESEIQNIGAIRKQLELTGRGHTDRPDNLFQSALWNRKDYLLRRSAALLASVKSGFRRAEKRTHMG